MAERHYLRIGPTSPSPPKNHNKPAIRSLVEVEGDLKQFKDTFIVFAFWLQSLKWTHITSNPQVTTATGTRNSIAKQYSCEAQCLVTILSDDCIT